MISTGALQQLVHELGDAIGFALELVDESLIVEGEYVAATARSPKRPRVLRAVMTEALAKIQISPNEADGTETWALVFWFINGQRVAPPGRCHLMLKLERGGDGAARWVAQGWEADVYEEWTGLERLEDEDET